MENILKRNEISSPDKFFVFVLCSFAFGHRKKINPFWEDITNKIKVIKEEDSRTDKISRKIIEIVESSSYRFRRSQVMCNDDMILKSTWNHQIINPIIEFLLNDTEILIYQWDNGVILSTVHEGGLQKKGDFYYYFQAIKLLMIISLDMNFFSEKHPMDPADQTIYLISKKTNSIDEARKLFFQFLFQIQA
ncbi:hypothetical protein C2G38_2028958 [Gigaspora rosea]|uniref:Uncharacterized protein n=1 Tax=Gigaspora rosea TaxID=44941 RepID=A0A397VZK4_9GLOM|nr:hypothetical protein C2G38_2028958 [Gigaspora rosea]